MLNVAIERAPQHMASRSVDRVSFAATYRMDFSRRL
jgi:hypothetical protein